MSATDYFSNNVSKVSLCALGIAKHLTQQIIMLSIWREVPTSLILILMNWSDKCWYSVRWRNSISEKFKVIAGVRQCGVISPILFSIYMDVLIQHLESAKFGCVINGVHFGWILYANDIVLFSTPLSALQIMLNICENFDEAMVIKYNCKKCMAIKIELRCKYECEPLQLCGIKLLFVNEIKYLGIYICLAKHF